MSRMQYVEKRFHRTSQAMIVQANDIIAEYRADGLDLTLRQLYYQFVARGLLDNKQSNYKRLGNVISNARLAGLVDWNAIVDRTRNLYGPTTYGEPSFAIDDIVQSYKIDLWENQARRVEVWVEKEALSGVIGRACRPYQIDYFPCRGYVSQSAQWRAATRLIEYVRTGQRPVIVHLGDHDPSGIDMTRDIFERLQLFMESHGVEPVEVERIALNMDQVRKYSPPPNPAKMTDSRVGRYIELYGNKSWELDALDPNILIDMISEQVGEHLDAGKFEEKKEQQERERDELRSISNNYDDVVAFLEDHDED